MSSVLWFKGHVGSPLPNVKVKIVARTTEGLELVGIIRDETEKARKTLKSIVEYMKTAAKSEAIFLFTTTL